MRKNLNKVLSIALICAGMTAISDNDLYGQWLTVMNPPIPPNPPGIEYLAGNVGIGTYASVTPFIDPMSASYPGSYYICIISMRPNRPIHNRRVYF